MIVCVWGGGGSSGRQRQGGRGYEGEKCRRQSWGGKRTEMECGSGHEARRCISSGFSWGSWLLEWGGGRKEQGCRGRGLVAMAAGTAGAQSAGTWSSGHGRGLTEERRGGNDVASPMPQGLHQEESFQRTDGRCWELRWALGPAPPHGGCQWGTTFQTACGHPGSRHAPEAGPWGSSVSAPPV